MCETMKPSKKLCLPTDHAIGAHLLLRLRVAAIVGVLVLPRSHGAPWQGWGGLLSAATLRLGGAQVVQGVLVALAPEGAETLVVVGAHLLPQVVELDALFHRLAANLKGRMSSTKLIIIINK